MSRLALTRVKAATAIGVLCALLVSGACTSGGAEEKDKPSPKAQPKKLKQVWQASASPVAAGVDETTTWTGHGILALRDGNELRGYDARSGKERWTLKTPEGISGVCGMSDKPNADGLGGLLFTSEKQGGCSYAGVVDLADGKVTWAKHVGKMKGAISIGDEALTLTLDCYGVKQFRPRDGKSLGTRLKSDKACAHEVDHNGRHLAVRAAPVGDAKEQVPGWIRADDGAPAHFALFEGANNKPVWRTKAKRVGDELHGVVSDDPLALDVSREGHRLIQTYDSNGKPVRTIGKELKHFSGDDGPTELGPYTQGETLVMGYERDPALYAYDMRTGKVRWKKRKDEAIVLGVWKDKLLALRHTRGAKGRTVPWLVTFGMRDGQERTIGRIMESGVQAEFAAWDDERIYLRRSGGVGKRSVIAYPLPRSGGDTRRYDPKLVRQARATPVAKRGWRKGDLRPDKVANACEAVSPTARKAMRVYRKGMPPPVECVWREVDSPRHADRELDVSVTAHQPGGDEESVTGTSSGGSSGPAAAVRVAKKAFRKAGQAKDGSAGSQEKVFADAHRLKGLGDEAKSSAFGSVRGSESSAYVLVRYRNVTVRVKARTEAVVDGLRGEVPPRHRVEAAARVAAADVLERLGADVPASAKQLAKPTGGGTTEVKSVCSRLRSEAARLAPGAKALDTTPKGGADGRVASCFWEPEADYSPELTVRVKAMPGSPLSGEGAAERAKAEITSAEGSKLRGIGDEARLERDTFRHTAKMNRHHTLTARKGNLVVVVTYQRWHHPSQAKLDADVKRVTRRVLSAY